MDSDVHFEIFKGGDSRNLREISPSLKYNGSLIDYTPQFAKTKHGENNVVYTDEFSERNLLLDAIVPTGAIPLEIEKLRPEDFPKQQPPDFRVRLSPDEIIYVECTRAGDSGVIAFEDTLPDVEAAMNEWLSTDPNALVALKKRTISFVPQTRPKAREESAFVSELKEFVLNEPLDNYCGTYGHRAPETFPLLKKLSTLILCRETSFPRIFVHTPAMATGGWHEASLLMLSAVRRKSQKVYDGFRPLWLAVGISNLQWPAADSFEYAKPLLSQGISPFSKVIFCNSNYAYVASAKTPDDGTARGH